METHALLREPIHPVGNGGVASDGCPRLFVDAECVTVAHGCAARSRCQLLIGQPQGGSARNTFHHSDHQLRGGPVGQALCAAERLPGREGRGVCDGSPHQLAAVAGLGGQEGV
jgi:hypothetical protein